MVIESLHPNIEEAVENRLRLHLGEYGTILLPVVMAQLAFYLDTSINIKSAVEATQVEHKPYGQWISEVSKTPPNR